MKIYKHEQTWWRAELVFSNDTQYLIQGWPYTGERMYKELIENSSDWKLMTEEKDWIDKVIEDVNEYWVINRKEVWESFLRKAIERLMPTISEKELDKCETSTHNWKRYYHNDIKQLLKEKGLLS